MYPTNFTVLDEMLACSHYRTNPQAIRINQDVPTYFYAVQRSRLPMIAVPLGRGLSDTNTGEVSQNNSTRKTRDHGDSSPTPCPVKPSA
ncbi:MULTISPECIES: hypothetical protein [unclassified Calothrix]|uniref:hypothetical protein n=1 Tax=unclassified Calothrix TaxID=2619626 RepID=UPI0016826CC5|nr:MULTISPECIES: hypothetical protein [unclassified Calothrix]MBD2204849.1 hypothetical protein [Calothrix sp. FACHB-168]